MSVLQSLRSAPSWSRSRQMNFVRRVAGALGIFAALSRGGSAQSPGLVAAYGFNENNGKTTADISGNGNTGTLGSGVSRTASGKFGRALVFSGGYVTVPHAASLNLTMTLTIEAWVYPTQAQTGVRR